MKLNACCKSRKEMNEHNLNHPTQESGHARDTGATLHHHVIGYWEKNQQLAKQSRLTVLTSLGGWFMFPGFLEALPSPSCPSLGALALRHGGNWFDQLHCRCLISKHGHTCPSVSQRLNLGPWLQTDFCSWQSLFLSSPVHTEFPRTAGRFPMSDSWASCIATRAVSWG